MRVGVATRAQAAVARFRAKPENEHNCLKAPSTAYKCLKSPKTTFRQAKAAIGTFCTIAVAPLMLTEFRRQQ
eukprot:9569966-Alexandrium_andersonii.AAC.1